MKREIVLINSSCNINGCTNVARKLLKLIDNCLLNSYKYSMFLNGNTVKVSYIYPRDIQ